MKRCRSSPRLERVWLALECGGLFIGLPTAEAAHWLPVPAIPLLLAATVGCWATLRWHHKIRMRELLSVRIPGAEWPRILVIYLISLPLLAVLLWLINPSAMFFLTRWHPWMWLLIMVGYPLLSVFPQELIYRAFFFERYRAVFGERDGIVLASASAFSFAHVMFHNWPAVLLTFAGGYLFATTYERTKSLLVVSAEHALYGCAIFTIGYGGYFFDLFLWLFR